MSELQELQNKEIEILQAIHDACEKLGLRYTLIFGSLLGAVRHKGFIPWDDDVDIYVMGKDYPRLKEVFLTQDTGNLRLHDYTTAGDYPYSFPKIVAADTVLVETALSHLEYRGGVYIDVFLLQETSANPMARFVSEKLRYLRYCLLRSYYFDFQSPLRKAVHRIVTLLADPAAIQSRLYRRYEKVLKNPGFLVDTGTFGQQALLDPGFFANVHELPYEDAQMPVPGDHHSYLTHYYGDYMQLPPEESRISNHSFQTLIFSDSENTQ